MRSCSSGRSSEDCDCLVPAAGHRQRIRGLAECEQLGLSARRCVERRRPLRRVPRAPLRSGHPSSRRPTAPRTRRQRDARDRSRARTEAHDGRARVPPPACRLRGSAGLSSSARGPGAPEAVVACDTSSASSFGATLRSNSPAKASARASWAARTATSASGTSVDTASNASSIRRSPCSGAPADRLDVPEQSGDSRCRMPLAGLGQELQCRYRSPLGWFPLRRALRLHTGLLEQKSSLPRARRPALRPARRCGVPRLARPASLHARRPGRGARRPWP